MSAAVEALDCQSLETGEVDGQTPFLAYSCQVDGNDFNLVEVNDYSDNDGSVDLLCAAGVNFLYGSNFRLHGQPSATAPNNDFTGIQSVLTAAGIETTLVTSCPGA